MQPKIATVTLILAGLLGLSLALAPVKSNEVDFVKPHEVGFVKPHVGDSFFGFPDFAYNFAFSRFRSFFANSANGFFNAFQEPFKMQKMSEWTPKFTPAAGAGHRDSVIKAIEQLVKMPDMQGVFNQVTAQLGFLQTLGSLVTDFTNNVFKLTLTATNVNGTCVLGLSLDPVTGDASIDASGLGPLGPLVNGSPKLLENFSNFLSGLFKQVTPPILESLLKSILPGKIDFALLCKEIEECDEKNYPQPQCCTC